MQMQRSERARFTMKPNKWITFELGNFSEKFKIYNFLYSSFGWSCF